MKVLKSLIKAIYYWSLATLPPKLVNRLPFVMPNPKERWAIGIYQGPSPFELTDPPQIQNPVLSRNDVTDVPAGLVADPFMITVDSTAYMFFEVLNQKTWLGEIGLATSSDLHHWSYQQIVLTEPFHLSYPYIFEHHNEYYLLPESHQAKAIRLYKASNFPTQWTFVGNLLSGSFFVDPSLFWYEEQWWLWVETNADQKNDTLRLYSAPELLGPWTEHPKSPIVAGNAHTARPAGRVLKKDNQLFRFAQDCLPDYGTQVRVFEIVELSATQYREVDRGIMLSPSGTGWNGSGMHHVDLHCLEDGQWLACVDGRVKC